MIKIEDLHKYVGKEVFIKHRVNNTVVIVTDGTDSVRFPCIKPAKVTLAGFSLLSNDNSKVELDIKICSDEGDFIRHPRDCKDLYETEKECQKECLEDMNEGIEDFEKYLDSLKTTRREREK